VYDKKVKSIVTKSRKCIVKVKKDIDGGGSLAFLWNWADNLCVEEIIRNDMQMVVCVSCWCFDYLSESRVCVSVCVADEKLLKMRDKQFYYTTFVCICFFDICSWCFHALMHFIPIKQGEEWWFAWDEKTPRKLMTNWEIDQREQK